MIIKIKGGVKKIQCDLCLKSSIWVESSYIGAPDQWFKVKMEIDPSRNDRHIENYGWDVCPKCIDPDLKNLWGRFVHRWKYIRGRSKWIIRKPDCPEPVIPKPEKPIETPNSDPDCEPRRRIGLLRRWINRRKKIRKG